MEGTNISTDIMNTTMNCFAQNMKRMYRYGRDKFTNGLPEGTIGRLAAPSDTLVQTALDKERPPTAPYLNQVVTAAIDTMVPENHAKEWLSINTDWDPDNDQVTLDGVRYLWVNTIRKDDNTATLTLTSLGVAEPVTTYRDISVITPMVHNHPYLITIYHIITAAGAIVGKPKWWVYDDFSGKYPELTIPSETVKHTQYLPVVPLRINNNSLTDPKYKDTPLYKTSKKLLDIIDLSIEELHEGINNNPDIDDVDHAYLVFGVDVHTKRQQSDRYLFEYFNDLVPISPVTKADFLKWDRSNNPPVNVIDITDGTYVSKLVYYYIETTVVQGVIGKVGHVEKSINGGNPEIEYSAYNSAVSNEDKLTLAKQISPTNYISLTVFGLFHSNKIYGPDKDYITTLQMSEERSLLVPINISIMSRLPTLHANTLAYDSFRITFNAYEWVKLKWYQTGIFKFVTAVLAVALTIVFAPSASLLGGLIAAAGAGVVSLGVFLAQSIITTILGGLTVKFMVRELGGKFATIVAIIAAVYGVISLPDALQVLQASVQDFVGSAMESLSVEFNEFQTEMKAMQAELEAGWNELTRPIDLFDPMRIFTDVGMYPNEDAASFLERSLMDDPATLSLNVVNDFYESALYLPV